MSDTNHNWILSIIGARLLGPGPINDVYVPFESSVTAYYGLNGAGKTRLVNAISDLLQGRSSNSYLVAEHRTVDDNDIGDIDIIDEISRVTGFDFEERAHFLDSLRANLGDVAAGLSDISQLRYSRLYPQDRSQLFFDVAGIDDSTRRAFVEIARGRHYALTPINSSSRGGRPDRAKWRLDPAVIIEPTQTPQLHRELLGIEELHRRLTEETEDRDARADSLRRHMSQSFFTSFSEFYDVIDYEDWDEFEKWVRVLGRSAAVPFPIRGGLLSEPLAELKGPLGPLTTIFRSGPLWAREKPS